MSGSGNTFEAVPARELGVVSQIGTNNI